ncbi:hypothetical protein O6P43_017310 [Quillaja saponaria]|uniref:Uncharacterized protein n=1 Tax=Quillaja saponaria TaxID=32244 RepID=A0AAD7PP84_QUISA|nr:hypothetical protein O6P43_017310 [Quillaja saponaria]
MIQFSSSLLIRPLIRPAYKSLQPLAPQAGSFYRQELRTSYFNHNLKNERINKLHQRHYVASRITHGNEIIWEEGTKTGAIWYLDIKYGMGDQCAEKGDELYVKYRAYAGLDDKKSHDIPPYSIIPGTNKHAKNHVAELEEGIYGMKRDGTRRFVIPHNHKQWYSEDKVEYKIYDLTLLNIIKPGK